MKEVLLISLLTLTLMLSGCSNDNSLSYSSYGNQDSVDREESYSPSCQEPENPYNDGGGHDAGFNWAQENEVDFCDGNSDSFIEGCEEYVNQLAEYNTCIESQSNE